MNSILILLIIILIMTTINGCVENNEDDERSISFNYEYGHYPTDIEWKPDGEYALICGGFGTLYKTDGKTIENITYLTDGSTHIDEIIWHPTKDEALLLSLYGTWVYNGETVSKIPNFVAQHGAWHPSGEYAILMNGNIVTKYYNEDHYEQVDLDILRDDYERPKMRITFKQIAWKPDGSEALLSDYNGYVFKYSGEKAIEISNNITNGTWYYDICWNPDGSEALLVGKDGRCIRYQNGFFADLSDYFEIFETMNGIPSLLSITWDPINDQYLIISEWRNLVSYKDGQFTDLSDDLNGMSGRCKKIIWRPGGDEALILVVQQGDLIFKVVCYNP